MSDAWRLWAEQSEPYGKGRRAPIGSLRDSALLDRLRRYKRQVARRYRVIEPEIIERALPNEELFISPKLDGELWFLIKAEGDIALTAYNGRILHGVSLLDGVAERLRSVERIVIAGELVATPESERPRSHHVNTALSDGKLESTLSFSAFDLVEDEGQDALVAGYEQRYQRLVSLLGEEAGARCSVVLTQRGAPKLVTQRYREWVGSDRFEGVVVRSDRGLTYKIKPTSTVDLVIIAFGERITGDTKQVREFQVALIREDGSFQLIGSVGTGLSEDDRVQWHERLSQLEVDSSFRLANREGTLCRFVRPEIVIEVRVSDFISSDGWDAPIRRMSLSYRAESGWAPIGETRTAVFLHPTLLRERTDKSVDMGSVGMSQLAQYLEQLDETPVKSVQRASAEIVARAVFAKETKGLVAVRKYVVVRTHKEQEGSHPPFVVFFSDYSIGRKEPLQTALRTADALESAESHVRRWVAENVKKGWSEVVEQRLGAAPLPDAPVSKPPAKSAGSKSTSKTSNSKTSNSKTSNSKTSNSKTSSSKDRAGDESAAEEGFPDASGGEAEKPKRTRKKKSESSE